MFERVRSVVALAGAAFVTLLLGACASVNERAAVDEQQDCPTPLVLVCTGGTVSKTGGVRDREPRICQCRHPDRIN